MKVTNNHPVSYYVASSEIWKMALKIRPSIYEVYQNLMDYPATKTEVMSVLNGAWIVVAGALRRHEPGTEALWEIPYPMNYSRTCIEMALKSPYLIPLMADGTLTYFRIQQLAERKGVLI